MEDLFKGHYSKDENAMNVKRELYCMVIMTCFVLLYAGCSASLSLSDEEVIKKVKEHYLFYRGGEEIDAEVLSRGEYIKECKCYPVKFKILASEKNSYEKTFYFFKKQSDKGYTISHFIGWIFISYIYFVFGTLFRLNSLTLILSVLIWLIFNVYIWKKSSFKFKSVNFKQILIIQLFF